VPSPSRPGASRLGVSRTTFKSELLKEVDDFILI